jgi:hypothetical protein
VPMMSMWVKISLVLLNQSLYIRIWIGIVQLRILHIQAIFKLKIVSAMATLHARCALQYSILLKLRLMNASLTVLSILMIKIVLNVILDANTVLIAQYSHALPVMSSILHSKTTQGSVSALLIIILIRLYNNVCHVILDALFVKTLLIYVLFAQKEAIKFIIVNVWVHAQQVI